MRIRFVLASLVPGLLVAVGPVALRAQLEPPNEAGVAMGHIHLLAKDVEATRKFFVEMGGTPVQYGRRALIQFPGVFVMVSQGEPTGGTVGSVVNHVGFKVRNMQEAREKWKAAGVPLDSKSNYLTTPEGVRIEIQEDPAIAHPLQFFHVHTWMTAPAETQAWYQKMFGAVPGIRMAGESAMKVGDIPGANLTFSDGPRMAKQSGLTETAMAGTKGRALDHIGFEVKNLEQFCKKLEAAGVKFDRPFQRVADPPSAIAFLTDPWGTYIELTENLGPPAVK